MLYTQERLIGNDYKIFNIRNYLILFILWPFLAFIVAIMNYSNKDARKVVYLFLIYYGLSFVNNTVGVDAFQYALRLKANTLLPFSDFFQILSGKNSDTTVDIIEPFISFIISRFTSNYALYFGVWAAIFGFFYLKSVDLLYDRYREKKGLNSKILMIFFIMIIPITFISGVRMWTAGWIFFYGAYHVVLHRDARYFGLTIVSCLLHWSFLSANVVLFIYFFLGNRNLIYFPLAIASFVLPQLLGPFFKSISTRMGGAFQKRYEGYSNAEYIQNIHQSAQESVWFINLGNILLFYYLILSVIFVKWKYGADSDDKEQRNLFSFLLLFLAFVNFGMPIPSFGTRFQIIFFLFATLYLFLILVRLPGNKIYPVILIGLFPMLLFALINFRLGSESINAWILSPCFGIPLFTQALSLAELIFQ